MDQNDETLLEREGWTVECRSPFELRHMTSNSFASGLAAELVLQAIRNAQAQDNAPKVPTALLVAQLNNAVAALSAICDRAREENTDQAWKLAYGLVFSSRGGGRVRSILSELNIDFDFDDPDGGYDDDVRAFITSLQDLHHRVHPMLEAMKAIE